MLATVDRYMGVDPTCRDTKPTACAILARDGSFLSLSLQGTDAEIVGFARHHNPRIVAIDSPLGLPEGMCCLEESCACQSVHDFKGRTCERELIKMGIRLYVTTKKSFIKPMIYRSMRMARDLRADGIDVLEVYPFAAKVFLFGKPIPPKTRKEGLDFLKTRLFDLIPGLDAYPDRLTHDHCDALVAAYTAFLHSRGETTSVGSEAEVPIVVPNPA